jgi:hypothetical protein
MRFPNTLLSVIQDGALQPNITGITQILDRLENLTIQSMTEVASLTGRNGVSV